MRFSARFLGVMALCASLCSSVQLKAEGVADTLSAKGDIIKRGLSYGPLPVVAFDQNKGFQYGALLNIYDFGDGSYYPNVRQSWYIEASAYTKGSQQYVLSYDTKYLIPNVRFSAATCLLVEKMLDFYGFNGYESAYDEKVDATFYRMERVVPYAKADFIGSIIANRLYWEAGYHFKWFGLDNVTLEGDEELLGGKALYEKYQDWGIIGTDEAKGGRSSALRVGLIYDSRDFEPAPSKGVWAEAHAIVAPKALGTSESYYRYSATFRQYLPLAQDRLVFAYRLNYQGTFGNYAPFYVLPYYTYVGPGYDRDGFGGYRTTRGVLRNRVQALDVAMFNAEMRWKFYRTHLFKQNVYFALNGFADGTAAIRNYDTSYRGEDNAVERAMYDSFVNMDKEKLHLSAGGGLRIGINQNFIIAVDYGVPFDSRDGAGSLYINTGFLF
ncbi:MAG: BamA/TamA family outer membrane protein [Paludibacteraceae bacterium]|nr:BamA/TamA family outer membrane protein [Paludibacteraceae bacterium]